VLKTASELKQLKVSTAILLVVGSLSVGTGLWFVLDDFPFTGPDDYSAKFGMRKDQMPPTVVASSLHAWDQVGFLSISYGMFVIALAWFGVRRGNPIAWIGLLLGGTPAAIGGPIELRYNLETGDAGGGDVLVWLVLALFIAALAIPAKQMIAALKAMPPVQKV
jgi:hypothetical protein